MKITGLAVRYLKRITLYHLHGCALAQSAFWNALGGGQNPESKVCTCGAAALRDALDKQEKP